MNYFSNIALSIFATGILISSCGSTSSKNSDAPPAADPTPACAKTDWRVASNLDVTGKKCAEFSTGPNIVVSDIVSRSDKILIFGSAFNLSSHSGARPVALDQAIQYKLVVLTGGKNQPHTITFYHQSSTGCGGANPILIVLHAEGDLAHNKAVCIQAYQEHFKNNIEYFKWVDVDGQCRLWSPYQFTSLCIKVMESL